MALTQAPIPIDNPVVFGEVKAAIDAAFSAERVGEFLKALKKRDLRIRDFDAVLPHLTPYLPGAGKSAQERYGALAVSDQALIREHYLTKLEQVDPEVRRKFSRVYRYE